MKRTCVISLGISGPQASDQPSVDFQDYARGLARIKEALVRHGYSGGIITWDHDYPTELPTTKRGHFAFKPYCFAEAHLRGYEIVLWLDSSIVVKRAIDPLLEHLERDGYLFFPESETVGEYCSDAALVPLGITREESFTLPSCWACVLGLDLRNAVSREFLRQWTDRASDGVTFPGPKWSGVRGWPRTVSQDRRVKGHRHDQTAASVIGAKLGMTNWRSRNDFFHFFDNDRSFVRKLNENFGTAATEETEGPTRQAQPSDGIAESLQAIAQAPTAPDGYRKLGRTLTQQRRSNEAIDAYTEALRLDPLHAPTHVSIADVLLSGGNVREASLHYDQAVHLAPRDPEVHRRQGLFHLAKGEWTAAHEAFRRGVACRPQDVRGAE
jgi:hypothetical protein